MYTRKKTWASMMALVLVAAFVSQTMAFGQFYDPEVDLPKPTKIEKQTSKLGRGLSNILLGWTEIPLTYDARIQEGKSFGYLLGTATVQGITRAFIRTGVGVYEVFTFPVSREDINFDPILEPEYIF